MAGRKLRILFSMRNFWYVKLFEAVVRELASRGHAVHVLAARGKIETITQALLELLLFGNDMVRRQHCHYASG